MITGWWRTGLNIGSDVSAGIRRTATQTVLVETDGSPLTRAEIEAYPECPKAWESHPLDPDVWCKRFNFNDNPDNSVKVVTFEYDNQYDNDGKLPTGGPRKFEPNPLLRPCEITRSTWVHREEVHYSMDNKRVETTAGERLMMDDEFCYEQFNCVKNLPRRFNFPTKVLPDQNKDIVQNQYSPGMDSIDFVNSDNVTLFGRTYPERTLWATNFRETSYIIEGNYIYYTLSWNIRVNPNGWARRLLNAGFHEKQHWLLLRNSTTQEVVHVLNTTGLERNVLASEFGDGLKKLGYDPAAGWVLYDDYFEGLQRIRLADDQYPRTPVLLDDRGRAFRDWYGNVVTPDYGSQGRTANDDISPIFRYFRTKQLLDFTKNLPLDLQFNGKA